MMDKEPTSQTKHTKDGQTITVESCYREDVSLRERILRYLLTHDVQKDSEVRDGSRE